MPKQIHIPISFLNFRIEVIFHHRWESWSKDRVYRKHRWPSDDWSFNLGLRWYESRAVTEYLPKPKTMMFYLEINPIFEVVTAITRHYKSEHQNEDGNLS